MPSPASTLGLGALIVSLAIGARPARAEDTQCHRDAMIVFDTSGSMQAREQQYQSRLDVARLAMQGVLPEITAQRRTGLIVFGAHENCSVELKLRLARDAGSAIKTQLDRLSPGAETPIAGAVEQAVNELEGRGIVTVVTDGEETCGGDPCALGQRLQSIGPDLTVHVIGYKLPRKATPAAKCLAESTGGRFLTVDKATELAHALREVLLCPKLSALGR